MDDLLEIARRVFVDPAKALERLGDGGADSDETAIRSSWRSAYIASHTDHRLLEGKVDVSRLAVDPITLNEFDAFSQDVWVKAGIPAPLYITAIEDLPASMLHHFRDADATARWEIPFADKIGMPRTGKLAGTTGTVAYVDVTATGLRRLIALHEIAHLLVDTIATTEGHSLRWATTYGDLQYKMLGEELALTWAGEWSWWLKKAVDHIDTDQDWLSPRMSDASE